MAKRQATSRPVLLKEVLKEVFKPGDWEVLKLRRQIRQVLEAVVPASLLAQSRLVDLKRKELWVEVSASPWGQELQFLKPRILQALEKVLGPNMVRDVRFKVGSGFGGEEG